MIVAFLLIGCSSLCLAPSELLRMQNAANITDLKQRDGKITDAKLTPLV